jgi:hypothetical protein
LPTALNPTPTTVTAGSTNTTYDQAMPQTGSISSTGSLDAVPMWWYLVMALSAGFNDSVRGGITNADINLRDLEALGRLAAIKDPQLKANIDRFYSECYIPARSQFMRADKNDPNQFDPQSLDIIDPSNTDYGPTDVDWMGSNVFVTDSHFYPKMYSKNPVVGFAPAGDAGINNTSVDNSNTTPAGSTPAPSTSTYGWPSCYDWWMDGTNGVRALINNQSESNFQKLQTGIANVLPGSDPDQHADAVARIAAYNNPPTWVDATNMMGQSHVDAPTNFVRDVGGAVGTLFTLFTDAATMMATVHMAAAIMMMQALILMAIYMLLPMIVLFSGYKLEVMFYGAMAIFTVKFWAVLWFVANWIDGRLYDAMYPNPSIGTIVNQIMDGAIYKGFILDILLFGMWVGFPIIWSGMMAWIGIQVGIVLTRMMGENAHPAKNNTGMDVKIK